MATAHTELDANSNTDSTINLSKPVENTQKKLKQRTFISLTHSNATLSKLSSTRLQNTLTFWSVAWTRAHKSKPRRSLFMRRNKMEPIKLVSQSTNTWTYTRKLPQDLVSSHKSHWSPPTLKLMNISVMPLLTRNTYKVKKPTVSILVTCLTHLQYSSQQTSQL